MLCVIYVGLFPFENEYKIKENVRKLCEKIHHKIDRLCVVTSEIGIARRVLFFDYILIVGEDDIKQMLFLIFAKETKNKKIIYQS